MFIFWSKEFSRIDLTNTTLITLYKILNLFKSEKLPSKPAKYNLSRKDNNQYASSKNDNIISGGIRFASGSRPASGRGAVNLMNIHLTADPGKPDRARTVYNRP